MQDKRQVVQDRGVTAHDYRWVVQDKGVAAQSSCVRGRHGCAGWRGAEGGGSLRFERSAASSLAASNTLRPPVPIV